MPVRFDKLFGLAALTLACWMLTVRSSFADGSPPAPASLTIDHLSNVDKTGALASGPVKLGLNGWLAVVLKPDIKQLDVSKIVLLLNGGAIPGLPEPRRGDDNSLLFHLVRNSNNLDAWKPILGSPNEWLPQVRVSLQVPSEDTKSPPQIIGGDRTAPTFQFLLISGPWLGVGALLVLMVIVGVVGGARTTNLLRDSLLPQLPPGQQTYSLGRCQMAFWFALIFTAFVFLLLLLWDYNTVTSQALILMGLSGATAIFAVQIDASKDTPIGAANQTLRLLGLNIYNDVLLLQSEIKQLNDQLINMEPSPDHAEVLRLRTEITSRQSKLRTWRDLTAPFVSQGWYKDLTTDVNGPALHRLQVFYWTIVLGAMFIVAVYRELAMPEFSNTLLALMGVTSAGYLGFKYPEQQS
jgi:hypothetical protein